MKSISNHQHGFHQTLPVTGSVVFVPRRPLGVYKA